MMVLIFETCFALELFLVEDLFGDPVDRDTAPTEDQVYPKGFVLVILVKPIDRYFVFITLKDCYILGWGRVLRKRNSIWP